MRKPKNLSHQKFKLKIFNVDFRNSFTVDKFFIKNYNLICCVTFLKPEFICNF